MRKAIVTGAAGFIGSHLVDHLLNSGFSVVGIDNLRSGQWNRINGPIEQIEADIADLDHSAWTEIVRGADYVFHLAAEKYNSSKTTPARLLRTNVDATERLARAVAEQSDARLVFTSSLYAYGSLGPDVMSESDVAVPRTLYGASKLMGEHILRSIDFEIGLSWNVARLFFIYGPKQYAEGGYKSVIVTNFERLIRGEKARVFGDGRQSLDYVFVDDCVSGLLELAKSQTDGQTVNIASGRGTTVLDLLKLMQVIAGVPHLDLENFPPDWTDGSRRVGNPSTIASLFGWNARTELHEGLRRTYDWMKTQ